MREWIRTESGEIKLVSSTDFVPPARLRGLGKSVIREFFDRAPQGSINLGLGEPDLRTPQVINAAAVRAIEDEQNGYTTHAGLIELRELVAADYSEAGAAADATIITTGSQEALYLALMTLVDAGDEVLIPNPGFVAYKTMINMAGGTIREYVLPASEDFDFNLDAFHEALTPRTKVVIVTSPSNPTGRTLSQTQLASIADALKKTNAYVISDEIYRELYFTPERPATIADLYPRTIVVGGLSKAMSMTGWRLGWLCAANAKDETATRSCAQAAITLHGYVVTCASTVSQKAALAAWSAEAEVAREHARRIFRERREHLLRCLRDDLGLRAVTPDGAFYTMVDVGKFGTSMQVAERALLNRVITVPGAAFGTEAEGYLRVSFCAGKEALTEGARRLGEALSK